MDDGLCLFANWVKSPNYGYPRGTHSQLTTPIAVVDHRGKRPFPGGPTEFLKVGFDWDNVIRLTDTVIGAIPNAQM